MKKTPNSELLVSLQGQLDGLQEQLNQQTSSQQSLQAQVDSLKNQLDQFFNMARKGGDDRGPVQMKMQSFQMQLDDLLKQLKELALKKEVEEVRVVVRKVTKDVETLTSEHFAPRVKDIELKIHRFEDESYSA